MLFVFFLGISFSCFLFLGIGGRLDLFLEALFSFESFFCIFPFVALLSPFLASLRYVLCTILLLLLGERKGDTSEK